MTKKEEAFKLFSEGKSPSDAEVKALGLAAKSTYNYYQEYKKTKGSQPTPEQDELQMLNFQRNKMMLETQIRAMEEKAEKLPQRVEKLEGLPARVERLEKQIRLLADCLEKNDREISAEIGRLSLIVMYFHNVTQEWWNQAKEVAEKRLIKFERETHGDTYLEQIEKV